MKYFLVTVNNYKSVTKDETIYKAEDRARQIFKFGIMNVAEISTEDMQVLQKYLFVF